MSCSNDSACSLLLADRHGRKEGSVMRVRKGITSFDYCKEWNIIGGWGRERVCVLVQPHVTWVEVMDPEIIDLPGPQLLGVWTEFYVCGTPTSLPSPQP